MDEVGVSDGETFTQALQGDEGVSPADMWRKITPSGDNSKCKGPEAGTSLECLRFLMLPLLCSPEGQLLPASVWRSLTTFAHLRTPHFPLGPGVAAGSSPYQNLLRSVSHQW